MKRILAGLLPVIAAAVALGATASPAHARDSYIAEVFLFAGTFCPRNTLPADGRELAISEYTTLFSLLGTNYGGDGRTTFALPDLSNGKDSNGKPIRACIVVQGTFPSRP